MIAARRSFTLIEIAAAVGILGMILLVSIPVLSSMLAVIELKSVARGIVTDLRLAQELSSSGRSTVAVEFLPKGFLGEPARYVVGKRRVELPEKFDFKSKKTITFSPSGFTPPGGSGTVTVTDMGGRIKRIMVSSAGRVRME